MPDPLIALELPLVFQDTDAALVETFNVSSGVPYRLGSGIARPYPLTAPLIPKGAGPYPAPSAPTAGSAIATGDLVANGHYKWVVTLVTDWGETIASAPLDKSTGIGVGKTGQTVVLPGWVARLDNPVRMRRLYRTVHTGSAYFLVTEIDDAYETQYVDEVSDTELNVPVPVTDTSGAIGGIDVFDGTLHWVEVAYVPSASLATHTFSVDYSVITGGCIYFSTADVGVYVTVTYHAGTLLGSTWMNQYQSALQEVFNYFRTETTPEFSHNLKIDGNLNVLGTTTLGGTLSVAGATTLSSVNITGTATLGSLTVVGTSHLEGYATFDNGLTVTGGILTDTIEVSGVTDLDGSLDVLGATVLNSSLNVTGATSLNTLTVSGGLTGGLTLDSLTVTGATSLNTLSTSGAATLASASVTGAISGASLHITGTSQLDGAIIGGSTISATGTITGGSISTGGTITASGNITSTATITGGVLTSTTSIGASTSITAGGAISGASLSVSGNISAPSGTISSSGAITSGGTITGANVNATTAMSTPSLSVGASGITSSGVANLNGGLNVLGTSNIPNIASAINFGSTVVIGSTLSVVGTIFAEDELSVWKTIHTRRIAVDDVAGHSVSLPNSNLALNTANSGTTGASLSFAITSWNAAGAINFKPGTEGTHTGKMFTVSIDLVNPMGARPVIMLTGFGIHNTFPWVVSDMTTFGGNMNTWSVAADGWTVDPTQTYCIQYVVVSVGT